MPQSQFDALVQSLNLSALRLMPGQVIIDQDPLPIKQGSLYLPQREDQPDHPANTGTVLAIGQGTMRYVDDLTGKTKSMSVEGVQVGDRVVYRLLMSDLNRKCIFTDIRRIDAVIESLNLPESCGNYSEYQSSGVGCTKVKNHRGSCSGAPLDLP